MSRIEEILLLGAIPRVGPAQVHAALEACPEPDELHRLAVGVRRPAGADLAVQVASTVPLADG